MGATLPVLTRALSGRNAIRRNLGQLYGWNTLGAMTGAITAELILVPAIGVLASGFFALGLNLVAAVIALRMSNEHTKYRFLSSCCVDVCSVAEKMSTRGRRLLAVAFLSGALMLALEVVWFRFPPAHSRRNQPDLCGHAGRGPRRNRNWWTGRRQTLPA